MTRLDQTRFVAPHRAEQIAQAFEDRAIAQAIAVVNEQQGVMFFEIGGEDVSTVSDATAEARVIEDVDDRASRIGDRQPTVGSPSEPIQ